MRTTVSLFKICPKKVETTTVVFKMLYVRSVYSETKCTREIREYLWNRAETCAAADESKIAFEIVIHTAEK